MSDPVHNGRLSATLHFDEPASVVKLVSPARHNTLRKMGIESVRDLLDNYPLRYIDMSHLATCASAEVGQRCTVLATIHSLKVKRPRRKLSLVEITIADDKGTMMITCFNQPWLADKLKEGMLVSASGKVEFNYGFKRMTNPILEQIDPTEDNRGLVLPIHPRVSGLTRQMMRRIIENALDEVSGMYDPLPLRFRARYRLCSRYQAYRAIHKPSSMADVAMARRRLVYEELFNIQLFMALRQRKRDAENTPFVQPMAPADRERLSGLLPYTLSPEQNQAVDEILAGMAAPHVMNHLLLGDVGTGKTVVSCFGLVCAAKAGHQALMIGPTEVLARQYGEALGGFLDACGIEWDTLTGSTDAATRASILERLEQGGLQVLFGTHALIEPDVVAPNTSLIVIDEQQRFGVDQRAALLAKAPGADVLSMTATPIPRSLALAIYGDLTLSYLKNRPASRAPITTHAIHFSDQRLAYDAIRDALARGEQAYVVCPLIGVDLPDVASDAEDEDDEDETAGYAQVEQALEDDSYGEQTLSAATDHAEMLAKSVFPEAKVGLLHGRMSGAQKDEIMSRFRAREIDILVSTTVIEVGVDVPNATVMMIEDADRFGLAQLHQLRGRVGRGGLPGEVFLVSRSKAQTAIERLTKMETCDDGFELSAFDLEQRKPGDIFGTRQHGKSSIKLVNVIRDAAVIEAAYKDVREFLDTADPSSPEWSLAMRELAFTVER